MARDYKHRANKAEATAKVVWWKWLLIVVLIALFVVFLIFLQKVAPDKKQDPQPASVQKKSKARAEKQQKKKTNEPRYDFYTILPESEIVVPSYEINTRSREEKLGKEKSKVTKYLMQVGSFRDFSEADRLRAKLALMGIESRVERAKVGSVVWNRVKMGPYSRSSSVSTIRKRLRENGIDVIVTEIKG